MKNKSELVFEKEVIDYLTNIGGVKQWKYAEHIKTTDGLWENFKNIIEQNNQSQLDRPLSTTEFNQVKKVINDLRTPYKAGQFLYGINGVSQIDIDLDDGKHVFLTIFDQAQVGAGNTVYQIVNQIERPRIIDGKKNRRFDVTMLINGLPVIQIELKKAMHLAKESLNQMEQYIAERQFGDIFSTLQILVAMTPHEIRYMSNTSLDKFNRAFAFQWQDEDSKPVRSWKTFSDMVLSIPMAHEMATRYMVLDGTKNKENIKVMRPYQVYATRKVLDKIRQHKFKYDDGRLGYIWHTTGSGKTITSFKTAWLASRYPNVDKVIFLVDRIALTNQTTEAYQAYDPVAGISNSGIVEDTANIGDLHKKLKLKTDKNIIVTSIQKMSRLVERKNFKDLKQNILFIVDEAHRSTGDGKDSTGMLEKIRSAIPTSAWIGYTGTPKFPETYIIFGDLLHAYTIKEAIADKNVLGFKVEFKETIKAPENPSEDDIDDNIKRSVYDEKKEHVELVVEDILKNWSSRSKDKKYNGLFTVHVGGMKSSVPRVMEYFDEFIKENKKLPEDKRLKIAATFSQDTSNSDNQLSTNTNLHRVIDHYNGMFATSFDMSTLREYSDDLTSRLNKSATDGRYLDLVIVIDQLLTGFDAPELNSLYIDRTLKGSGLIQAYSRTNRIHSEVEKPWGNVVNYRWPEQNELEMNKAFAIYSNRDSAAMQMTLEELQEMNTNEGLLAKPYDELELELKELVENINILTEGFSILPPSEVKQEELFTALREYNGLVNKMKQYPYDEAKGTGFPLDNLEDFYSSIGITEDEEIILTTSIANELKEKMARKQNIDISHIDLAMEHIQEIQINYDYLVDLIARMADEINEGLMSKAVETRKEIDHEIAKISNEKELLRMKKFVNQIFNKDFVFDKYPAPRNPQDMNEAMIKAEKKSDLSLIGKFIYKWGLGNAITPNELNELISHHKRGRDDLDKRGEITGLMNKAKPDYTRLASKDVAELSWIAYRNSFRKAIYDLAEEIKEME